MMNKSLFIAIGMLLLSVLSVYAEIFDDLARRFTDSYPSDSYILGVGVVQSSGDDYKDRRRSEILARLELTKIIRISAKGNFIDIMCEGKGKMAFDSHLDCQNQLIQIVEESVDVVLEGSKIVDAGDIKSKNLYYAVAVLPKKDAISKAVAISQAAMEKAYEHFERAKTAKDDATRQEEIIKAKEEQQKSMAYDTGKHAIEQVRQHYNDMFNYVSSETPMSHSLTMDDENTLPFKGRGRVGIGLLMEEGYKIEIGEGEHKLGGEATQDIAQMFALNKARQNALEKAGVNIRSTSSIFNGELVSDLINTTASGVIVAEKILEGPKCDAKDGVLFCFARIEARIKLLNNEKTSRNRLNATVQRAGKDSTVSVPVFQDNDEVQVRVTATEDSFLNIFSIDQYGNVIKLYPNDYVPAGISPAKKEFVFPDESLRTRGLRLRVTTPKDRQRGVESVLVIATKEDGHFLETTSVQNQTITDLMKELSELAERDPASWTQKTVGYEVRK